MKTNRPNILYITFDQQRYDCVSMSGMRPVRTPNLQRIADKGVYFENAYTPIPVCAPVRQALMTGKRPECFGGLWAIGQYVFSFYTSSGFLHTIYRMHSICTLNFKI